MYGISGLRVAGTSTPLPSKVSLTIPMILWGYLPRTSPVPFKKKTSFHVSQLIRTPATVTQILNQCSDLRDQYTTTNSTRTFPTINRHPSRRDELTQLILIVIKIWLIPDCSLINPTTAQFCSDKRGKVQHQTWIYHGQLCCFTASSSFSSFASFRSVIAMIFASSLALSWRPSRTSTESGPSLEKTR